jgi:hypothetical protein
MKRNYVSWMLVAKSVVLPTWEAENRNITVGGWPEQRVCKNASQAIAEHGGTPVIPSYTGG